MGESILVQNTKLKTLIKIELEEDDWKYNMFIRKLLKAKGINHCLNKSIYVKYKNGNKTTKIQNNTTLEDFREKGVEAVEVLIQGNKYLSFMFFQQCRKKKFNMLSQLNTKLREERAKKYSEIINEQRKSKAMLTTGTPFKYPNSCLIEDANKLSKISQSLIQHDLPTKPSDEIFSQSINMSQPVKDTYVKNSEPKKICSYDHKIECDECQQKIKGLRQKCALCNFNICEKCRNNNKHDHPHNFFIEIEDSAKFEAEDKDNEIGNLSTDNIGSNNLNDKNFELKHCICLDLNEESSKKLVIPYKTLLKNIDLEIEGEIENCTWVISQEKSVPSFIIEFFCDNPEKGNYELTAKFISDDKEIDQKTFKILVKIKL